MNEILKNINRITLDVILQIIEFYNSLISLALGLNGGK